MSVFSRQHLILDPADSETFDVWVHDDFSTENIAVSISLNHRHDVTISGDPGMVVDLLRRTLDQLTDTTEQLGEQCGYCHQRGLNWGEFAQQHLGGFAHIGCVMDVAHLETELHELDG